MTKPDILFDASFFAANRAKLLSESNAELIVITAAARLQSNTDEAYPFRQDSNFWYLTGIDEPEYILVLSQKQTYVIMPRRPVHADLWEGAINIDQLKTTSGINTFLSPREGWRVLNELLAKVKQVHSVPAPNPYVLHYQFFTNPARHRLLGKLRRLHPEVTITDLRPQLATLRCIKQTVELEAIQHAIDITGQALEKLNHSDNRTEFEAEAVISYEFRMRGASGHAFSPILASGKNATTLHYNANNKTINPKDMLLADVGARYQHYNADLTRVLLPNRKLTPLQRAVYRAVADIQAYAISMIKPGQELLKYEKHIVQETGRQLKQLGLISDEKSQSSIRRYFPHSSGHQLGLDVHDVTSSAGKLQAGMVITVEPGIYIPEEGIGIRIEDDILVTKTGAKNLSGHWLSSEELLQ